MRVGSTRSTTHAAAGLRPSSVLWMATVFAVLLGTSLTAAQEVPKVAPPPTSVPMSRDELPVDQFPWRAVGRLNRGSMMPGQAGFCTAVLVAPKIVLTAAHCLADRRSGHPLPLDTFHFVAGWNRGSFAWHATVTALTLPPELDGADLRRPPPAFDWALLSLHAVPVEARPVPIDTSVSTGAVRHAGYHRGRAHVLTAAPTCRITSASDPRLLRVHDCPIDAGDSGSPLFVDTTGTPRLVGMITARSSGPQTGNALAVSMTAIVPVLQALSGTP